MLQADREVFPILEKQSLQIHLASELEVAKPLGNSSLLR